MQKNTNLDLSRGDLLKQLCLIDGQWFAADSGETLSVHDPANGNFLASVPYMGRIETERAIAAAEAALPMWRSFSAAQRAKVLRAWANLMLKHQDDLARILTLEQGKPMAESRAEIAYGASFLEWFAEEGKRADGEVLQSQRTGQRMFVLKQPVGVCAAITPWNFPVAMITRKAGPALAAGCTMVVKPAELTPLSALALGVLALEAGLPAGVLQILTGDPSIIGATLCENDIIRKLSFTGSTAVGKLLMRQCAENVKKLSLELGGNAPLLVFDDADINVAVEGIIASKFRNTGQTCVCANRIYVQSGIHDALVERLVDRVQILKVGHGLDEGVEQGPLINARAVDTVQAHISDALEKGAILHTGGTPHAHGGHFFYPTVLSGVTQDMRIAREETFGPVAPVFRFTNEEEVLSMANASDYGLASYLFTEDRRRIWRVSEQLECGMVGVNTGQISNEVAPFGGIKQSGLGREGSRHGLDEYQELKYICLQD